MLIILGYIDMPHLKKVFPPFSVGNHSSTKGGWGSTLSGSVPFFPGD